MTKNWTIVGQDLLSVVSCKEPYEWKDPTEEEWEFNEGAKTAAAGKKFKVSWQDTQREEGEGQTGHMVSFGAGNVPRRQQQHQQQPQLS
jgi:hypothetical protein